MPTPLPDYRRIDFDMAMQGLSERLKHVDVEARYSYDDALVVLDPHDALKVSREVTEAAVKCRAPRRPAAPPASRT